MIYSIHSDARYLNKANAHSRAGGHHYLSENHPFPPNNGAILTVSEIIKAVMSSIAEAELGALYINACKEVEMRNILQELGHHQPPYSHPNEQQHCRKHHQQLCPTQINKSHGHAFPLAP